MLTGSAHWYLGCLYSRSVAENIRSYPVWSPSPLAVFYRTYGVKFKILEVEESVMRSKPTITVVLLVAAALVGCGGGKNSTSSSSSTADTGVNGTYTGTFTPSNPAFPPF